MTDTISGVIGGRYDPSGHFRTGAYHNFERGIYAVFESSQDGAAATWLARRTLEGLVQPDSPFDVVDAMDHIDSALRAQPERDLRVSAALASFRKSERGLQITFAGAGGAEIFSQSAADDSFVREVTAETDDKLRPRNQLGDPEHHLEQFGQYEVLPGTNFAILTGNFNEINQISDAENPIRKGLSRHRGAAIFHMIDRADNERWRISGLTVQLNTPRPISRR